jgi:hypothetical protein
MPPTTTSIVLTWRRNSFICVARVERLAVSACGAVAGGGAHVVGDAELVKGARGGGVDGGTVGNQLVGDAAGEVGLDDACVMPWACNAVAVRSRTARSAGSAYRREKVVEAANL